MKKSTVITLTTLVFSFMSHSQTVRGSIQQGSLPNTVNIVYLPDHNSVAGEYVNYLSVSVAVPTSSLKGLAPTIAPTGIFSHAISFAPAVPFSYELGDETVYSWICPNNTSFDMSWTKDVAFTGAIVTFDETTDLSRVKLIDLTNTGNGGGLNQNTTFNVGVNVPPFDLTDSKDYFFSINGEKGSVKGTYSNGDHFVETKLSRNPPGVINPTAMSVGGIFPNPAREKINVIVNSPQREEVTLVVTDVSGKTVKQQVTNVEAGTNTVPVDVAKLAQGSYIVKLLCQSSDCKTATGKFNKL